MTAFVLAICAAWVVSEAVALYLRRLDEKPDPRTTASHRRLLDEINRHRDEA